MHSGVVIDKLGQGTGLKHACGLKLACMETGDGRQVHLPALLDALGAELVCIEIHQKRHPDDVHVLAPGAPVVLGFNCVVDQLVEVRCDSDGLLAFVASPTVDARQVVLQHIRRQSMNARNQVNGMLNIHEGVEKSKL